MVIYLHLSVHINAHTIWKIWKSSTFSCSDESIIWTR